MPTRVFTDGSYSTKMPTVCGVGIHFPNHDFKDVSTTFHDHPTNQRAELFAVLTAIQTIRKQSTNTSIDLYTDSKYVIHACTLWLDKWKQNGWRTVQDEPVKNQDLLQPLSECLEGVTFHHVHAHTHRQDVVSKANAEADRLAKNAIFKK